MKQNKPELVLLAQIIHGYRNDFNYGPDFELNIDELSTPQFGQKWRRLSNIAPKTGKIGRYVKGIYKNTTDENQGRKRALLASNNAMRKVRENTLQLYKRSNHPLVRHPNYRNIVLRQLSNKR